MNETAKIKKVSTNKLNKALHTVGVKYWDGLGAGIESIKEALVESGFNTEELDGIYCGREGRTNVGIGGGRFLSITWFKMEVTGTYEITSYAS